MCDSLYRFLDDDSALRTFHVQPPGHTVQGATWTYSSWHPTPFCYFSAVKGLIACLPVHIMMPYLSLELTLFVIDMQG